MRAGESARIDASATSCLYPHGSWMMVMLTTVTVLMLMIMLMMMTMMILIHHHHHHHVVQSTFTARLAIVSCQKQIENEVD